MGAPEPFVLREWADPLWRLHNIYWVLDDQGKEVPFVMRDEQQNLLDNLHNLNLILKSRQKGFSTLVSLLQLDQCIFNANFKAVTIADTVPNAQEIFRTKIDFPWRKLPESLRAAVGVNTDSKSEFVFGNGSSISVTTSARGGTLQSLHVSEFGKICAKNPLKAREIVSGSFEAVTLGSGVIYVESTAMGQSGAFYDLAMGGLKRQQQKIPETALDFRLHFYPWHTKPENRLAVDNVLIGQDLTKYFETLQAEHGIHLDPQQKAWYAKTAERLGDAMWSEHPSYCEEAFLAAIEGAIYAKEMAFLRRQGSIGGFPWVPNVAVNTFWDLGVSKGNAMALWLHQRVKGRNRLIGYIEAEGEGYGHFVNELNKLPYVWGKDYLPHDAAARRADVQVTTASATLRQLGRVRQVIVPVVPYKNQGIEALRSFLMTCEIDAKGCVDGIKALDNYQREWDERAERWSDRPLHNWASNGADSLMQGAQGYQPDAEWAPETFTPYVVLDTSVGY